MEEKISSWQVFWLGVNLVISTIILIVPSTLVGYAENIGWVSVAVAGTIMMIIQFLIFKYSFEFSNQGIVYDLKKIFGKYLGTLLVLVYLGALFFIFFQTFYQGIDFLIFAMPYIPEGFFWFGIAAANAYFAYSKIENMGRVNSIVMSISVLALVIIILTNIRDFNFQHLKPIRWDGKGVIKGSLITGGWFMQIPFMLLVIKPNLKDKADVLRKSLYANLFSQILVIILVILTIVLLSVPLTAELEFPVYNMARLSLNGLEIIIVVIWISGVIVKSGIYFFLIMKFIQNSFNLSSYSELIIPFGIMMASFTWYNSQIKVPMLYYLVNVISTLILVHYPLLIIILLGYFIKAQAKR
ncbi:GerAB/ArcD/ProY family transporter [Halonatronum saccharophilum]|uniref:GerAB/ArcD/ProY family transporter n=1 Tax=Halonatronum saccharophilum TaxID=150060 RepID=UPI0004827B67|nr:GerAB/ArcD/ProY family transporter [Halonatronum saccharophilum]